ncbi:MAG: 16S rRNA (uracil(1498)-N(3))-methyltransferase [Actinobacteria bacterium]|nr:16S rRNA (uracil(1498)-N(3))-methyltransferase [Actinomycetota bacterium]
MPALPDHRAAAHVFVADLERPELEEGDRHHLAQVLRLRPGELVTAADGAGRWCPCQVAAGGRLERSGDVVVTSAPRPALTVAIALTKGNRPELAVQKLTELGIDRVVPFLAARSVVRWDGERADRHLRRLRRVAREAAMQCRRAHLPEVTDLTDFDAAAGRPGAALACLGGQPPTLHQPTVLVGPEGGWSDEERSRGLPEVGIGPHILRAETAAIAVATLLGGLRAGLVAPAR